MLNRRRHTASFTGGTEAGLSGRLKREGLTSRDQKRVRALPCPGRRGAQRPWWVEGRGARDALSDRLSVHLLSLMGQTGRGAETPGCSGVAGTEPFPALLREGPQRLWPTHSLPGGGRTGLQAELKRDPGACTSRWVGVCLLSRRHGSECARGSHVSAHVHKPYEARVWSIPKLARQWVWGSFRRGPLSALCFH